MKNYLNQKLVCLTLLSLLGTGQMASANATFRTENHIYKQLSSRLRLRVQL